jgi:hypothetical protein
MATNSPLEKAAWIGFLVGTIFLSNYLTHQWGKNFYEGQVRDGEVFDILHQITPDLHSWYGLNDIVLGLILVSFIFIPNNVSILEEFVAKFLLIMFVRALTIVSTILPKHKQCESKLGWIQMIKGQCYDKVFSGHTAFVLLATLIYQREGIIGWPLFFGLNIFNILSIILVRAHYTIDIILAIVITYLVYDGDYHIFTDFLKRL